LSSGGYERHLEGSIGGIFAGAGILPGSASYEKHKIILLRTFDFNQLIIPETGCKPVPAQRTCSPLNEGSSGKNPFRKNTLIRRFPVVLPSKYPGE
jgi:hypothetical protein